MGNWTGTLSSSAIDVDLSNDILTEILLRVDDNTLKSCYFVNKVFYSILTSQSFWKDRCSMYGVLYPKKLSLNSDQSSAGQTVAKVTDYRLIYRKKPYGRNLIKNPSGENGYKFWHLVQKGGHGFKIESPPSGSDTEGFTHCFVTSYGWCIKEQIIDLIKVGCQAHILDEIQPKVSVSEWTAARFDCASTHILRVFLMRKKFCREMRHFNALVKRQNVMEFTGDFSEPHSSSDHDASSDEDDERRLYPPLPATDENSIIDEFHEVTCVQQWAGKAWKEIGHVFENYGPGLRYVVLQSMGKDNQFWAGHFGPKIAKSSVILSFN